MLILLRTQVDRTDKTPVTPVAPVSAVCAAFAAQPSVYPPEARRPDVAPLYGSVGRKHRNRTRWPREKPLAANAGTRRNGQNREILDAAARKQDKAAGSCAPRGGHICPRCGQFWGFARAFQKQRKTALGRCRMKKAHHFKENDGVPMKNTR